jgi:hypothetical protein
MAKTALTLLQDQIEAIRREAYTAGTGGRVRHFITFYPASELSSRMDARLRTDLDRYHSSPLGSPTNGAIQG